AQAAQQSQLRGLYAQAAAVRTRLQGELADLRSQSDHIAALLRAEEAQAALQAQQSQSGNVAPSAGNGTFSSPLPGAPETSGFGMRMDPFLHQEMMHTGVDFAGPAGTPIHAGGDGVVVVAGPMGGYGNATVIEHGGGLATLYGHQEQILVAVGQHVSRGQVIGLVGCTGYCTGPHVHFEVRVNGTPVDPLPYL
ncbi:MAG TPA: M23 family metallopeptidase, partial [Acidimicrobiales bacterium]|nr:M23 family metallopeptidase [Acidimicrobiales bacterium]